MGERRKAHCGNLLSPHLSSSLPPSHLSLFVLAPRTRLSVNPKTESVSNMELIKRSEKMVLMSGDESSEGFESAPSEPEKKRVAQKVLRPI